MMDYIFDIIDLLREVCFLLAARPVETGLLAFLALLATASWKALLFVLRGSANAALSYFLTERVLKRLSPPHGQPAGDEDPEPSRHRTEELARELGRREGTEEALREQLERERQRADHLEAELKKTRKPWWRGFG